MSVSMDDIMREIKAAADSGDVDRMLAASKLWYENAPEDERRLEFHKQAKSFGESLKRWSRPKFHMVDDGSEHGKKVYDSIEDYRND